MNTETALPQGDNAAAGASNDSQVGAEHDQQHADAGHADTSTNSDEGDGNATSAEQQPKEKTPEQRELARLRRRVDSLTRQKYEARAAIPAAQQQQQQNTEADDDEPVSMTRAEMQRHIAEQAKQLAPALTQQQAVVDRRQGIVTSLAKEWGAEKFDTLASDLDDVFGGLADRSGTPKPATDAIFESDDPKGVIEYLTDPDNAEEAERISTMSPIQAGRAITRLEDKLKAAKGNTKPKPSNAAQPLEAPRNGAGKTSPMPDPSNTKAYIAWANAQERAQR
ncbi:hypothetical protein CLU93_4474 [Janthinobacterium sp. 35]|uniref:hypothetical protein n=1 Tax=Janthinobacterium sp. 35 TaxID=2035210 RepID=UPI000C48B8B6|nr:hypothetical protein [Janthinobacterium sp. 35]PIG30139.1 hypothetical protein CLU93_4474 [Janthinobacterium sp. 35]